MNLHKTSTLDTSEKYKAVDKQIDAYAVLILDFMSTFCDGVHVPRGNALVTL